MTELQVGASQPVMHDFSQQLVLHEQRLGLQHDWQEDSQKSPLLHDAMNRGPHGPLLMPSCPQPPQPQLEQPLPAQQPCTLPQPFRQRLHGKRQSSERAKRCKMQSGLTPHRLQVWS
jgi:hypothetical protein